jgi:hypothetical protein
MEIVVCVAAASGVMNAVDDGFPPSEKRMNGQGLMLAGLDTAGMVGEN